MGIIPYLMWIMPIDTAGVLENDMAIPLAAIGLGISAGSALASIGTGIYNSMQQNKANKKNAEAQEDVSSLQREQLEWNKQMADRDFEYNKQLQEKIFQREDSAVQRMVEDNRKAGLSPIAGLSGASAGQALESNTPQLDQNLTAPQYSANQINADFSSLSNLGSQMQSYQQSKDSLKLEQERLDLAKSTNELQLQQMKQAIDQNDIKTQVMRATMQDEIEGKKLSNENLRSTISKNTASVVSMALGDDLKRLEKIQTQREMEEWLENKGIRAELGNLSLQEAKVKCAQLDFVYSKQAEKYTQDMQYMAEQLKSLQHKNSIDDAIADMCSQLGLAEGEGKLGYAMISGILKLFGLGR